MSAGLTSHVGVLMRAVPLISQSDVLLPVLGVFKAKTLLRNVECFDGCIKLRILSDVLSVLKSVAT
jgi:hypothetical protein